MNRSISLQTFSLVFLATLLMASAVTAQDAERWFQIEVSIFTNENLSDREAESWHPDSAALQFPGSMRRLQDLLDVLVIDALIEPPAFQAGMELVNANTGIAETAEFSFDDLILATGPFPAKPAGDLRLPDFERDAFLHLPPSASNFQQTNRAIERAADHRLLYHGLWRQPVRGTDAATPLLIRGGQQYGDAHELQGSLTLRFNTNADRVVVDADLWLSEFTIVRQGGEDWVLPPVPNALRRSFEEKQGDSELDYDIRRIYQLKQSRDMRSTEFHYIDHPALGFVILVEPYEVPPAPIPALETDPFR